MYRHLHLSCANSQFLLKFHETLAPLFRSVENNDYPSELMVSFAEDLFLEPQHIVLLASLIECHKNAGAVVAIMTQEKSKIKSYLDSIRFPEYWKPGFDRTQFTQVPSSTAFCFWQISQPMISQFGSQAVNYFQNKFLNGLNLDPLTVSMSEVFNNIYEHSKSPISGYTITQYFPRRGKLIMAVCDLGVGIPTTINAMLEAKGQPRKIDADAAELALEKNVTSQSTPRNKGYGLHTISGYTTSFGGSLMILSNFACLHKIGQYPLRKRDMKLKFPGTLIVFSLNTTILPPKEEENEDEFSF